MKKNVLVVLASICCVVLFFSICFGAVNVNSKLSPEKVKNQIATVTGTSLDSITFVKQVKTNVSSWQAFLYRIKTNNVKQPVVVFVNNKGDIVFGGLISKGQRVVPNLQPQDVAPQIENIDVSKLKKEDRMVINSNGKKTMFMFYNPNCPYCKNVMSKLANYSGEYKIIVKYVASPMDMDQAESELSDYLVKTKNITKDQAKSIARKLIEEDFNDAVQAQIMGTPMFFDETGKYYPTIPDFK